MLVVSDFIKNYKEADQQRISFAWNGKNSTDFEDANQEFRWTVVRACLTAPEEASPLLLEHLFLIDSAWCCKAWGAPQGLYGYRRFIRVEVFGGQGSSSGPGCCPRQECRLQVVSSGRNEKERERDRNRSRKRETGASKSRPVFIGSWLQAGGLFLSRKRRGSNFDRELER